MKNKMDDIIMGVRKSFFEDNHLNPIYDHPITKCDDIVRDCYLTMLCVFSQYAIESGVEYGFEQRVFIKRIIDACHVRLDIQEYILRAYKFNEKNIQDLVQYCKIEQLEEIFFVDCCLISCANGTPNRKLIDFLADIAVLFGLSKNTMRGLCMEAVAIMENDSEKEREAERTFEDNLFCLLFCYHKSIYNWLNYNYYKNLYMYSSYLETIIDNEWTGENVSIGTIKKRISENWQERYKEKYKFLYNKEYRDEEVCIFKHVIENRKNVVIDHFHIRSTEGSLQFKNCKSVTIRNSEIQNTVLHFENVDKIFFEDCNFAHIKQHSEATYNRAIFIYSNNATIYIRNCNFVGFNYINNTAQNGVHGGVLYINGINNNIDIQSSLFKDCKISSTVTIPQGIILCILGEHQRSLMIKNSKFIHCLSKQGNKVALFEGNCKDISESCIENNVYDFCNPIFYEGE